MFCSYCGNEIKDGVQFCSSCGAKIDGSTGSPVGLKVPTKEDIEKRMSNPNKQEILRRLEEVRKVCQDATVYYDIADKYGSEIEEIEKKKVGNPSLSAFGFLLGILLFPVILLIASIINNILVKLKIYAPGIGMILAFGIFIAILCIPGIIRKLQIKNKRELQQQNIEKGNQVFIDNYETVRIVDSEYWSLLAMNYIIKLVENDRASTWNGILNLCDEYLHRVRVENEHQLHTEYLKSIQLNSQMAASAAASAATSSFLRLFI